jgi:hypothetical protein
MIDGAALKRHAATALGVGALGTGDFGEDPFAENYDRLVAALNADGRLTSDGLTLTEAEILRLLRNRLEIRACLKAHPDILLERIERPVFLMGLPRSGTTFLQNLFDHDARLRLLRTWETLKPCPPPAAEPSSVPARIDAASAFLNRWREDVENFDATHIIDVTGPDECALVMNVAFADAGFQNYLKVPGYFDWMVDGLDFAAAYRLHRDVLRLLQWQAPKRRWVLKFPNHMLAMAEIRAVYPDAIFVATHRDPVQTLASLCALTEQYRSARYAEQDRREIGREMLDFVGRHIARFLALRDGPDGDAGVVDVDYYRLVADPAAAVTDIYARLDMAMPETVRRKLGDWIAANPKGKRGVHTYRLADYGLDADAVAADPRFAAYRRRFAVGREHRE